MFAKAVLFFVIVAVVHSQHDQPARYPAGVNPALCPGFPICDNALLHGTAPVAAPAPAVWSPPSAPIHSPWNQHISGAQAQSWNSFVQSHTQHSAPVWNQWDVPALNEPSTNDISGPGGDKYPAGVSPAACPNYPYCDTGIGVASHAPQVAPLPGWTQRQYPAGVSPASCPNFPYCH